VIATEPTELLVIPRSALLYLRDYNPNLAVCLYEIFAAFMGRRVRKLTGRLIAPLSY
jgi:CRP-like cAMP-binding protein